MIEFITTTGLVGYERAVAEMEARVAAIRAGTAAEAIWFLEHPALYTAGTSARATDLLAPRFPVFETGRGGQYTYHGPGQRVAYVMLDLQKRGGDVRHFVYQLEQWLIDTLAELDVSGERREGRIGIWVQDDISPSSHAAIGQIKEKKIAAVGVRVRHGVTYHGVSLNVAPDLSHFDGIVPCGLSDFGVTSLAALGRVKKMQEVDAILHAQAEKIFAI